MQKKDKTVAALLAFFLGGFGVHRFYLDQPGLGLAYLIFFWTGIPWIIGFIDFLVFISTSQESFDLRYNWRLYGGSRVSLDRDNSRGPSRQSMPQQRRIVSDDNNYAKLMREVSQVKGEIVRHIRTAEGYSKDLLKEILPVTEKYEKQVSELIERDRKLKMAITSTPLNKIDYEVGLMRQKLGTTTNTELKHEYARSIQKFEQHKKSILEFIDQREMIKLRLESTVMSLRQIKLDLLKMEQLSTQEKREEFFRNIEQKSQELSEYLDALKTSYDEIRLQ